MNGGTKSVKVIGGPRKKGPGGGKNQMVSFRNPSKGASAGVKYPRARNVNEERGLK